MVKVRPDDPIYVLVLSNLVEQVLLNLDQSLVLKLSCNNHDLLELVLFKKTRSQRHDEILDRSVNSDNNDVVAHVWVFREIDPRDAISPVDLVVLRVVESLFPLYLTLFLVLLIDSMLHLIEPFEKVGLVFIVAGRL